jgi:hypothetical protein
MKKFKLVVGILTITTILFGFVGGVFAQQVSLSISPPIVDAIMKPGKSIMVAYNIKNSGDPMIVNTKVVSFEPRDNFGNIRLKSEAVGPVRFSLDNANIQLGQPFFLNTGASQQLLLRMRLPENIPNADHYYTLLVETLAPNTVEGVASSRARATIGSNILITVTDSGIIDIKPKVTIFETLSKFKMNIFGKVIKIFDSLDKVPVVLYVENKGSNKIVPGGKISLHGAFGQTADYEIIPKNILSSSQRMLEATPSATISSDNPQSPTTVVLTGMFIGKYTLSANINFGENSPTVFGSTIFFGFPFKIMAGVIFLIVVTVYLTKRFSKDDED